MIAARPSRSTALRFAAAAVLFATLACRDSAAKGDEPPRRPTAGAANVRSLEPLSEVVIARPSQPYTVAPVADGGSIKGTVTVSSPLQPNPPQPTGRDSALCGASVADESVAQQGSSLGGVVVWLDDVRRGKPVPLERRLELESDHCRLTPRVQAGVVASAVNVIGHDDFRQHLRFLAAGEKEPRAAILLGRDEQVIPTELPFKVPGMVVVRDVDHPWPTAYLAVFDHPYFAVTAPNGAFTIDGVPPGRYTVRAWHERAKKSEQAVQLSSGGTATVSIVLQAK
ncbi:MAG: hypothetical protein JWL95_797 [Gemmatimonadetes bacterium]|nr:hypothetical protein [Gemmatimonadota bacterium]